MIKKQDLWSHLATTDKKIVMYGMGNGADKILSVCAERGIEVADFFASDGFVRGHMFHGKRVLSYSEAKEKYGADGMIVLLSFASSLPNVLENIYRIADECELYAPDVPVCGTDIFDADFYEKNAEKIATVRQILADDESVAVFDSVVGFKLTGDVKLLREGHSDFSEVLTKIAQAQNFKTVADLGAYNGDTLRELAPVAPALERAIAFEPDKRNFKKLSDYAAGEQGFEIEAHNLAAWKGSETLFFDGGGNRNSTLLGGNAIAVGKAQKVVEVRADSLDSVVGARHVDYIKYDVEGAEKEALSGSQSTISRCMPTLCVSLYHRSGDIFELPLMIKERFPQYKLYMRRREYIPAWDTVLIAKT